MNRLPLALAALLALLAARSALAAPGDARLLVGTIEWPAAVSTEPFAVVRGDDAKPYLASLASAQRRTAETLVAGSRVSLLGVEGKTPYEITVVAITPPPPPEEKAARVEKAAVTEKPEATEKAPPAEKPAPAWYYCASRRAYYPDVPRCPEAWRKIPAR